MHGELFKLDLGNETIWLGLDTGDKLMSWE